MEKNANYALVGLSTLLLTIGLVIFIAWIARISFTQDYDLYDILFEGPVRGLSQGGEVHFNGIKVGEVTKIRLNPPNPSQVRATVRVTSDVPIRQDSYAVLEPLGITGVNLVQISAGTTAKPLLKDVTPKDQIPVIGSQRSALSDLLEGGGTVLTRAIETLDQVKLVLSDKNIAAFSGSLEDIHALTTELRAQRAVIADARRTLQSIDGTAQSITALANGDGKRTLANLAEAATEAKGAATEARALVTQLQTPVGDFANSGLPQMTNAAVQLQQAAEAMERLANDIQASPQGALGKPRAVEIKVKP
jgi:phospholipid/cholesterol/gamma-HCH transport system substrate-binding protein